MSCLRPVQARLAGSVRACKHMDSGHHFCISHLGRDRRYAGSCRHLDWSTLAGTVAACQGVVTPQLHTGARLQPMQAIHPIKMAQLASPTTVGAHGTKPLHSLTLSPEHVRL